MNYIIKILVVAIVWVVINSIFIYADFDASNIIPTKADWVNSIADVSADVWTWFFDNILTFVRDSIFWILWLVAIGMFLYVGFSLVKAQWNPEDLKKAFMTLIHVIIGLFIVALSWALIKMISWFTF